MDNSSTETPAHRNAITPADWPAFLELAEVQALNRQPMYMSDWLARMDDFLLADRGSDRQIRE